jgi:hypothetical protein
MNFCPNVSELERRHGVRWCELADLEPRVQPLLWRARAAGARCRTWSEVERCFSPLRNELAGLLGFSGCHSRHPVLGSLGAYIVAYWKLYEAVAGLLPRVTGALAETTSAMPATRAHPADRASESVPVPAGSREAKPLQFAGIS